MSKTLSILLSLAIFSVPLPIASGVKGDLTDDGRVDSADALLLARVLRGEIDPATLSPSDVADVFPIINAASCGDGFETLQDLTLMLRALRGVDVDSDGLVRDEETALGTSPFLGDTDADGHLDSTDPAPLVPTAPTTPGNFEVFDGPSDVQIAWTAGTSVDEYIVHRYGTDGSYEFFVIEGALASFSDPSAQSGVVYRYWVQGVNAHGQKSVFVNCDITDPANLTLWLAGALGPFPNPTFSAGATGSTVDFNWAESPEASVTGYKIYSSNTPVPLGQTAGLTLEATIPGKSTVSHSLPGVASGAHYYRMTAMSATDESGLASAQQRVVVVN